jgi:hypothetical protein
MGGEVLAAAVVAAGQAQVGLGVLVGVVWRVAVRAPVCGAARLLCLGLNRREGELQGQGRGGGGGHREGQAALRAPGAWAG